MILQLLEVNRYINVILKSGTKKSRPNSTQTLENPKNSRRQSCKYALCYTLPRQRDPGAGGKPFSIATFTKQCPASWLTLSTETCIDNLMKDNCDMNGRLKARTDRPESVPHQVHYCEEFRLLCLVDTLNSSNFFRGLGTPWLMYSRVCPGVT